ncbi:MAG: IS21-like element helper ATPase IstB [Crocinitomicaceae bacterium]|nr:IS21-like element helper ATPase IstB [Crocinitomicaceae bacterium]MBL4861412.1 IS21-like element helper ATPase IstB [Crocinitomicaceae bacterium]MBL4863229.1 IS21-like element helper ATPase IstB [Crocinitomicaceae bacterium]MBL4863231.1 IS21-like element helper ATPase IstB [Crocinitomicaceae bacterium]MBL4863234.1 IS21-like element helper ATPase IstB [Crocinitomicaceae bacterium]
MNKNQTVEKLQQMRIYAMAEMYLHHLKNNLYNDSTPDEYIALLTDHEWEERQNKRIQRLIAQANFRQKASIADVDYKTSRNLEKNMFNRLSSLDFVTKKENLIITGASGVGKSYLTQAIGHQACLMGLKVQYHITARLFSRLKLAKVDGTYNKELKKLNRLDVLILDDFGLQAFDNHAREALMDIIEDRYNISSTFVSSQIPVSAWYDIIGEGTIADAILDRLVNSSHRINLKGESLRKDFLSNEK